MRAAYAALILGVACGLAVATGVLSRRTDGDATTVAGVLALDHAGPPGDTRRAEAMAVLVARCMTDRGFTWTPWIEPPPVVPDAELAPAAWAARWGFRVSTMVGRTEPPPPADPNLAAIGAASPAERDGYREALDGPAGCRTAATDTVYGFRERALMPLQASLRDLEARIATSPVAAAAVAAWRTCVAPIADGRTLDRRTLPSDLREAFGRRLSGLGRVGGLVAIQADERRVASVLAGCDVAYDQARSDAAAPFEAAFVREHRATIESIGAAIRSTEAAFPTMPP